MTQTQQADFIQRAVKIYITEIPLKEYAPSVRRSSLDGKWTYAADEGKIDVAYWLPGDHDKVPYQIKTTFIDDGNVDKLGRQLRQAVEEIKAELDRRRELSFV